MSSKKKNDKDQEASLREKYQLLREKKIKEQDKQEKEAKAKLEAQKLEAAKKILAQSAIKQAEQKQAGFKRPSVKKTAPPPANANDSAKRQRVDNTDPQRPKSPQYNYNDSYSQNPQQQYQPYDSNTSNNPYDRSYDVNTSQYSNPYDSAYNIDNKYDGYGNPEETDNPDYPCTVFVGDLGDFTDEAELDHAFGRFGPIDSIRLISGKNYAFIKFSMPEAAQNAIKSMNGEILGGGRIRTALAKQNSRSRGNGGRQGYNPGNYQPDDFDQPHYEDAQGGPPRMYDEAYSYADQQPAPVNRSYSHNDPDFQEDPRGNSPPQQGYQPRASRTGHEDANGRTQVSYDDL